MKWYRYLLIVVVCLFTGVSMVTDDEVVSVSVDQTVVVWSLRLVDDSVQVSVDREAAAVVMGKLKP